MCFPPSFFDIMPHLMMQMVDQIQELGLVYLHQMWTYEQFMSTLNRYVLNHAYPEGSMIEAYTTKEAVNCCTRYIWMEGQLACLSLSMKAEPREWVAWGGKSAPMYSMKWCKKLITASSIS